MDTSRPPRPAQCPARVLTGGNIEIGVLPDGFTITVRAARSPDGPALVLDIEQWLTFLDQVKDGQLDWTYEHSRFQHVDGGFLIIGMPGANGAGA